MSSAGWIISIIAILIVLAIAWNEFGVKDDWERFRRRWLRRRGH